MTTHCAATRAIAHLLTVRDTLEYAGRPDGDRIEITRQQFDAIIDDLAIVGRLIRKMSET
jgi:hypothetical protein